MRIVIALGGNALLRRGEELCASSQQENAKQAAMAISKMAVGNQLLITHGNGPQVGLLSLQNYAYSAVAPYPLDILCAETQGMIGYLLVQEISNALHQDITVTTLLTRVEINPEDSAFVEPTKPIGPWYLNLNEAKNAKGSVNWKFVKDNQGYRRVVASPKPERILDINPILWLLERNVITIAGGGGGIPVAFDKNSQTYYGVEAVIDKDLTSAILAQEIAADCFLIGTDVDAVYSGWGTASARPFKEISVAELKCMQFSAGTMEPKVNAACQFVAATQKPAIIGSLIQLDKMLCGQAGTRINP